MRVENGGVFRAEILRHLALHFLELFARADERLLEAVEFAGDFRLGHIAAFHALAGLVEHEDFPAANAGRHRNAPEDALAFVQPLGHNREIIFGGGFEKQFLC